MMYRCAHKKKLIHHGKTYTAKTGPFELPDDVASILLADGVIVPARQEKPGADKKITGLEAEIASLKKQIVEKDAEIARLKTPSEEKKPVRGTK